ncbi:MAG: sodium/substrate symporter small subunit, partial [Pseudomonadales bacterium]
MSTEDLSGDAYWKANRSLMATCLIIWFIVSFGFGIILRPM